MALDVVGEDGPVHHRIPIRFALARALWVRDAHGDRTRAQTLATETNQAIELPNTELSDNIKSTVRTWMSEHVR